jgi:hypothetical protein
MGTGINRDAWIKVVEDLRPNLAVTLGMGLNARPQTLNKAAKELCCRIERKALGARWAQKPRQDRLWAVGFHEHPNSNRHIHVAVHAPDRHADWLMTNGNSIWREIRASGDWYCEPLESPAAYARYITKDLWKADTLDDIFIYVPR